METNTRNDHHAEAVAVAEDLELLARRFVKVCQRNTDAPTGCEWSGIEDDMLQQLQETPLSVEKIVTYRVTIGTGGPAHGVDFDSDGNARAWYQDWFVPKTYVPVDDAAADTLAMAWAVAGYDEGFYGDDQR